MRIAILGATSEIARDTILAFSTQGEHDLVLFGRRPDAIEQWLKDVNLSGKYAGTSFASFGPQENFDAIINFVGSGNPAQTARMGETIFDATLRFDEMVLETEPRLCSLL